MPNLFAKAGARALAAVIIGIAVCTPTQAQSTSQNSTCTGPPAQTGLLNEVHTIAADTQAVPLECTFDVSVAGNYQVTLTDLGVVPGSSPAVPAPLAAVKLAVTTGSTIVGTPLTATGSMQFAATTGSYVIRVVGTPGTQLGSGPIGIQVTNVSDSSLLASFSQNLALPNSALPSNEATLDDSFSVATDGSYVVTLTDLLLPQALTVLQLIVTTDDGTLVTNPALSAAGSTTVTLQHGVNYRIFAVGQSDPSVNAGLYSATVTPAGGGSPAYSKLVSIGSVTPAGSVTLSSGTAYTFSLRDLSYPDPLTALTGLVVADGQVVASLTAAGTSTPFTSIAATYVLYVSGATGSAGSFTATLAPASGPPALSIARAVVVPGSASTPYSFDSPPVATAGTYEFDLADFAASVKFASVGAVAVQNGQILGTPLTASGSQNLTVAAGPVSFLVFAQPGTGGGLFGIDLTTPGSTAPLFQATQGVGQLFSTRQVTFTAAGDYALTVSDVGFPTPLSSFAVYLTQGINRVGSVFGGGPLKFSVTPGTYYVNFIAQPGGTDNAGTYALAIVTAPAVTFTSDVTTVASGGSVKLTWSSQNATGCVASGGWSGTQTLSGTTAISSITAATTFTLTCSVGGVSDAKSVYVTVTDPPAPASKGGGGALSDDLLLLLGGVLTVQVARRRRARPRMALC
jgi:hypothetical protein